MSIFMEEKTAADHGAAGEARAIDLRSDTVTRPTAAMLEAMISAEVGDDVYGEDPTVGRLEQLVAELTGKERGLFVPTGVMSNQLCLAALTRPGDEVIVGEASHIFNYETGAPALLSGLQLHTVADPGGVMSLEAVDEAIRPEAYYLPPTSVIALEQTHNREGGTIIPKDHIDRLTAFGRERGIAMHLDGARIWNASAASGVPVADYCSGFDTVSLCLSKGLGAPVGSVMAGTAEHVRVAHRFRKIWGGGWRQAGILAAAGIYAIENHRERLAQDHENARRFAGRIAGCDRIELLGEPETNIVIFRVRDSDAAAFVAHLAECNVLVSAAIKGKIRAVFHMDVSPDDSLSAADTIVAEAAEFANS